MSGFSSAALPGRVPSTRAVNPNDLFSAVPEYLRRDSLDTALGGKELSVEAVKVCIFDLSDKGQREEYEKLWARLITEVSKGERDPRTIDARKDLVHRADGTSYWMKYIEYVELKKESENDGQESDKEKMT